VDATDINPWNWAMSRFRFDILDNNDVVRGRAEIEVENYIDVIKEVEATIQISDYEMKVDDYYTLQFWYSGVGEFYILYGSQQCPSRLSIPTDSVKSESSVDHDKGEGKISVSSIVSDSCAIADIKEIELRIFAPWETDPVFTELINASMLENASLESDSLLSHEWSQWTYREDLDTGAIPEGNYTIEISVLDNSSNVWKEIHEVNLFVFIKVTTVILIVIGGTSVLGAFGWVYRDIIKFGAFSLMFAVPLMSKTVDTDRTNQGILLQVIHDNPGVWYEEVKRKSGITNGTAVYHLRHLEKEGKIVSIRDKNKKRYFQRGESALTEGRYITNTQQAIHSYIKSSGSMGMTPKQIGTLIGLSRRRVRDYLTNMVANDFIEYRPDPRDKRIILYYAKGLKPSELTPAIREDIHEILSLAPNIDLKTISERIKQLNNVTISEQQIDEFLRTNYPSKWQNNKENHEIKYHR
jgi:DNA-binding MarR family transcriptional regulator